MNVNIQSSTYDYAVNRCIVLATSTSVTWHNLYYIVILLFIVDMISLLLNLLWDPTLIHISVFMSQNPSKSSSCLGHSNKLYNQGPLTSTSFPLHPAHNASWHLLTGPGVLICMYFCVPAGQPAVFGPPLWRCWNWGFGRCVLCSQPDLQYQQGPSASPRHRTTWQ